MFISIGDIIFNESMFFITMCIISQTLSAQNADDETPKDKDKLFNK